MRSYSSGVRPCCFTNSGVMAWCVINEFHSYLSCCSNCLLVTCNDALENRLAVRTAENRFACALWMRHQSRYVSCFVADSGDVFQRTVRVGRFGDCTGRIHVAPEHLVICVEFSQRFRVGKIASFPVRDWNPNRLLRNCVGKRRVSRLRLQKHMLAPKLQRTVADERTRKHSGLAKNLETVTDPQHHPAVGRKRLDCLHNRAESSDGSGTQIITVTETTWNDYDIRVAQRGFLMPEQSRRVSEHVTEDMDAILVAIRSWKLKNNKVHTL